MSDKLATINELQPIAKRLREREEQIGSKINNVRAHMGDALVLFAEQGRDIITVETKLAGHLSVPEWLKFHVPTLPIERARKYKRVATEQLNERQVAFLFYEEDQSQKQLEDTTKTATRKPWDFVWHKVHALTIQLDDFKPETWPAQQFELTRTELEPLMRKFFPEKFLNSDSHL